MKVDYSYTETNCRAYHGISVDEHECRAHLQGPVKNNLTDKEERNESLERLNALYHETGFEASDGLLEDIRALEDENLQVQHFRIGEAYAEVLLEQQFSCRFYWNELRDARNPKGNKTGADLIGFVKVEGEVHFLFGEVKTSSEVANRPPQVMTGKEGIEAQLKALYSERNKRLILISYLKNKMRLFPDSQPFTEDFVKGINAYYSKPEKYLLQGVLIRDVEPDERDLEACYCRLKNQILDPTGLNLIAVYLPYQHDKWLEIINETTL